jgi:hypothetical protein
LTKDIAFTLPEYLMIDASDAEYNAAKSCFGDRCIVLTCWFHVMKAVKNHIKENKDLVPIQHYDDVIKKFLVLYLIYYV